MTDHRTPTVAAAAAYERARTLPEDAPDAADVAALDAYMREAEKKHTTFPKPTLTDADYCFVGHQLECPYCPGCCPCEGLCAEAAAVEREVGDPDAARWLS